MCGEHSCLVVDNTESRDWVGTYRCPSITRTLRRMVVREPKAILHGYLRKARRSVLWKLDGLAEYDARRPLVPSGTNLLGLVKHLGYVELGYFGETFDRPSGIASPWFDDDAEDNVDMWALPEESRDEIVARYRRASELADATIDALDLDARGHVPWWGDDGEVTLQQILVHVTAETARHAGHADVIRELIDGRVGFAPDDSDMPTHDPAWWQAYRDRVETDARRAAGGPALPPA